LLDLLEEKKMMTLSLFYLHLTAEMFVQIGWSNACSCHVSFYKERTSTGILSKDLGPDPGAH